MSSVSAIRISNDSFSGSGGVIVPYAISSISGIVIVRFSIVIAERQIPVEGDAAASKVRAGGANCASGVAESGGADDAEVLSHPEVAVDFSDGVVLAVAVIFKGSGDAFGGIGYGGVCYILHGCGEDATDSVTTRFFKIVMKIILNIRGIKVEKHSIIIISRRCARPIATIYFLINYTAIVLTGKNKVEWCLLKLFDISSTFRASRNNT